MPDQQQSEGKLRDYIALAPEAPIHRYVSASGVRVTRSSRLPPGYVCLLLTLDPGTLRSRSSRTLLVSEDKAPPKVAPDGRTSDGAHLQVVRRIVHAWLRASDAPRSERLALTEQRVTGYMDAAEFATGSRHGWLMPMAIGQGYASICHPPRSPAAFLEAVRSKAATPVVTGDWRSRRAGVPQVHKKHSARADVYWMLETNRGHTMLIRTGSAVSDTLERDGLPALPDGWHLRKSVAVSPGMRGSVLARFRKIRTELDEDPVISFEDKRKIRAVEEFIRHARKSPRRTAP